MNEHDEMTERSPALDAQSDSYPASWRGKVPKRVKMAKTVESDVPLALRGGKILRAMKNDIYDVWVNSHGAIAVYLPCGEKLGLKPYEFEVIQWH